MRGRTSVIGVVESVRQAKREVEAGVDIIVAQGHEAGDHKCGGFDKPRFRKPPRGFESHRWLKLALLLPPPPFNV